MVFCKLFESFLLGVKNLCIKECFLKEGMFKVFILLFLRLNNNLNGVILGCFENNMVGFILFIIKL